MNELDKKIDILNKQIDGLLQKNNDLRESVEKLEAELQNKTEFSKSEQKQIHNLKEEVNKLKVVSAISGNEEYKKSMKLKLNKLIKEIDLCLVELKSI